jgi:multicomponent Na+:H+ antiporter subunit D
MAFVSAGYALQLLVTQSSLTLQLLDNFGITLIVDQLSGYFILTNALVTTSVILYCWRTDKTAFFYTQAIILHGSVNAAFVCADFISLYVALEVISIAAFLLIAYPRTDRSIWVALRYMFVSNVQCCFIWLARC